MIEKEDVLRAEVRKVPSSSQLWSETSPDMLLCVRLHSKAMEFGMKMTTRMTFSLYLL